MDPHYFHGKHLLTCRLYQSSSNSFIVRVSYQQPSHRNFNIILKDNVVDYIADIINNIPDTCVSIEIYVSDIYLMPIWSCKTAYHNDGIALNVK